ncbi:class I SAM-dependent methyltransferase [Christiangramia fulva]|nr:class I SAM-dependent methyltransferase [Christiangramia fulva]
MKVPYFRSLHKEIERYKRLQYYPPGHYYSPIVDYHAVKNSVNLWEASEPANIDLNVKGQLELLSNFPMYYNEIPWKNKKVKNLTYYFQNDFYSYTDGILLYSMIRYFAPKRIIEIGSGFSSALMIDTNHLFFKNEIDLTFIEPYPARLNSLVDKQQEQNVTILEKKVQEVPLEILGQLEKGDILFIDSSHVSKTGSDVNYILFEILPRLKKGVIIHFHDIFYPFEYPKLWVYQGRNWNENYLLRAFLIGNENYKILLFSDYLHKLKPEIFEKMPLLKRNTGGNIWLEKIED